MLTASAITHRFGSHTIVEEVDFALSSGEIVGLAGPSGIGKSTFGRLLAGHLQPTTGRVEAEGAPVVLRSGQACPVQYAPQVSELSVDPRWRVGQILGNGGVPDPEILQALGVNRAWHDRYPAEISGGELTRVSLARLVLPSTRYLVCDEIAAPLDALASEDVMLALRQLVERGLGILLISHNRRLLMRHTDRCLEIQSRKLRSLAAEPSEDSALPGRK